MPLLNKMGHTKVGENKPVKRQKQISPISALVVP